MRVAGDNPRQPLPGGSLQNGQLVRGKLAVRDGAILLRHRGGVVRVHLDPSVSLKDGLFRVQIRDGRVFLLPGAAKQEGHPFPSPIERGAGYTALLKKMSIFRGSPQEMKALFRSPDLYTLFSFLPSLDQGRSRRLLDLYLRLKKSAHPGADSDDSNIRGELSLSEGALKDFLEHIAGSGSEDAGEGGGKRRHQEEKEFLFALLPVTTDGGETALPLLVLGESGQRRRSWLFSECTLSRLGLLRMVLIQDGGSVYGSLFCSPGVQEELKESLAGLPYRVAADTGMADSFAAWPVEALAELSEEGEYGEA